MERRSRTDIIRAPKADAGVMMYFALLLFVFQPAYFSQFHILDLIFDMGKILVFVTGIYGMIRKEVPIVILGIGIYSFFLLFSTAINGGNYREAVTFFINSVGSSSLIYTLYRRDPKRLMSAILLIFEFLIYGNLLTVIIAPQGLYRLVQVSGWWTDSCWFLGIRNGMTPFYIIGLYLELLNMYITGRRSQKIRCLIYVFLSTFTVLKINISVITGSAGGLILIWFIALGYFILCRFDKALRFLDLGSAAWLNILFSFLLIFFGVQKYFSYIIITLLHKDLTLSSRVAIWNSALNAIRRKPLFGYGIESGLAMSQRLGDIAATSTTQNGWLDLFYKSGIMGFICVVALLMFTSKTIKKKKLTARYSFLIGYCSAAYMLAGQGESLVGARFFSFVTIIYVTSFYIKQTCCEAENEEKLTERSQ